MFKWAQDVANENGYVIVRRRSKATTVDGLMNKVVFMCDHGGVYRGKGSASTRNTGTRKTDCPFKLIAKKTFELTFGC